MDSIPAGIPGKNRALGRKWWSMVHWNFPMRGSSPLSGEPGAPGDVRVPADPSGITAPAGARALLTNMTKDLTRHALIPQAARVIRDPYPDRVYLVLGPVPAGGLRMPERAQLSRAGAIGRVPLPTAEGAPLNHHPGSMAGMADKHVSARRRSCYGRIRRVSLAPSGVTPRPALPRRQAVAGSLGEEPPPVRMKKLFIPNGRWCLSAEAWPPSRACPAAAGPRWLRGRPQRPGPGPAPGPAPWRKDLG
jgi:hypothetical protein